MTNATPVPATSRRLARAVLLLACFGAAAALPSCAPKITKIDASYTMPEGVQTTDANMIVWLDQPTVAYAYDDNPPADPDSLDTQTGTLTFARYTPSTLHGMILDHTQADGFQLFRRESGGGIRQFANYTAAPVRQWLSTQYEAYHFIDESPSSYTPASYIGRGVVEGVVNMRSPLTNIATTMPTLANIQLTALWYNNRDISKGPVFNAPKIKLDWTAVPGAARYLLQVFEFRSDLRSEDERILAGSPAPIYDGQSTDMYLGFLPPTMTSLYVGDSTVAGLSTIAIRPFVSGSPYIARLVALDANNHMIGISIGDDNPLRAYTNFQVAIVRNRFGNNTFMLYRVNGTIVHDPPRSGGGGGGGLG